MARAKRKMTGVLDAETQNRNPRGRFVGKRGIKALLLTAVIGGFLQPALYGAAVKTQALGNAQVPSVVVVATGSGEWGGPVNNVLASLRSRIHVGTPVYTVRFDADRDYKGSSADGHPVRVPAGTPMKDAILLGLTHGQRGNRIDSVVVIGSEQSSPTHVGTDELLKRMVRAEVPVHTIHLRPTNEKQSFVRRSAGAVASGVAWLIEALIEEDRRSYSSSDTGRLMHNLSSETGGLACVASDQETGTTCAQAIADGINDSILGG